MIKYKVHNKSDKSFLRWCSISDKEYQNAITYFLKNIIPMLEDAGFAWVETSPDGYKLPSFMIDMERNTQNGLENIVLNFDKYKRYKFAITCTISNPKPPYNRKVISRLVRYKSELDKASWWGASIISLNKPKTFRKKVDKVSKLLPQILEYLETGQIGPNVFVFERPK